MSLAAELAYSSIGAVGPLLARKELSPVELTRACLERIDALDSKTTNAFITVTGDAALEAARRAEAEIGAGAYRGPLHGIPIAHKDLIYTRGVRTTAGSRVLRDFVPREDATVVARLEAAGAIGLGKLNMHEFAAGGTSDNPYYGPVRNPWRLTRHPGGSSGGSAAALAAGLCLGATGTDTAGSIRLPSHCCGTSGIKPSYGRVSSWGVVPLSWSLDHVGPMARSARDAALMLTAMAGFDRLDSASVDRPAEDFTSQLELELGGLRMGVATNYFTEGLEPDVERCWHAAIEVLSSLGVGAVDITFSQLDSCTRIGERIVGAEMTTFHSAWYAEHPDWYSARLRERFGQTSALSAIDLVRAQRAREQIRADLWAALDQADFLVVPTMANTATRIGDEAELDAKPDMTRFTYPFNLSGFPAMTLPCGFDDAGLPIGLQLAAAPWQESLLLRVAHQFQLATEWHLGRPLLDESVILSFREER